MKRTTEAYLREKDIKLIEPQYFDFADQDAWTMNQLCDRLADLTEQQKIPHCEDRAEVIGRQVLHISKEIEWRFVDEASIARQVDTIPVPHR